MCTDKLPIDQIIQGDCVEILNSIPTNSIDLIFADPPYFLQLRQDLYRPNLTKVDRVDDEWDQFDDWNDYDNFNREWLTACRRILKDTGTIWVIGTYHNIYRIGSLMQDLGFWFLNDLVWIKTNPMPNFKGVRFTNAHETLIWASKLKKGKYTFNYHAMKEINEGLQMRSDWRLPICTGRERIRINGKKLHSTQKPLALLYRILLSSSNPGDVILDPFFGTGTMGVAAKILHRHWVGIEKDPQYVRVANDRIQSIQDEPYDPENFDVRDIKRQQTRLPFSSLLENGLLWPGQALYFNKDRSQSAIILPDSRLAFNGSRGSIHQLGRSLSNGSPCNGWDIWFYESDKGELKPIDDLRNLLRESPSQELDGN
jgi:modification methylase